MREIRRALIKAGKGSCRGRFIGKKLATLGSRKGKSMRLGPRQGRDQILRHFLARTTPIKT